jgi:hypothetical protein
MVSCGGRKEPMLSGVYARVMFATRGNKVQSLRLRRIEDKAEAVQAELLQVSS